MHHFVQHSRCNSEILQVESRSKGIEHILQLENGKKTANTEELNRFLLATENKTLTFIYLAQDYWDRGSEMWINLNVQREKIYWRKRRQKKGGGSTDRTMYLASVCIVAQVFGGHIWCLFPDMVLHIWHLGKQQHCYQHNSWMLLLLITSASHSSAVAISCSFCWALATWPTSVIPCLDVKDGFWTMYCFQLKTDPIISIFKKLNNTSSYLKCKTLGRLLDSCPYFQEFRIFLFFSFTMPTVIDSTQVKLIFLI